jgi:DNA repair exonuclease SbcCD ATPase subunit
MAAAKEQRVGLTAAADALEAELQKYEELAVELQRERVDSEKALRRAAQRLVALQASDARLGEHVQALVAAINGARDRQQALAATVETRAAEVRARSDRLTGLLERWEALGSDAAEVNRLIQRLAPDGGEGNGAAAENGGDADTFVEVDARLGRLTEDAERLAASALEDQFPELGRRAESLRVQLASARNKLRLVRTPSE